MSSKIRLKLILIIVVTQLIWWGLIVIPNEFLARIHYAERSRYIIMNMLGYLALIMPIIILFLYYLIRKKVNNVEQISNWQYCKFMNISWIIIAILIFFEILYLLEFNYIGYCNPNLEYDGVFLGPCFLSGMEYFFLPVIIAFLNPILLLIVTIIKTFYLYITRI